MPSPVNRPRWFYFPGARSEKLNWGALPRPRVDAKRARCPRRLSGVKFFRPYTPGESRKSCGEYIRSSRTCCCMLKILSTLRDTMRNRLSAIGGSGRELLDGPLDAEFPGRRIAPPSRTGSLRRDPAASCGFAIPSAGPLTDHGGASGSACGESSRNQAPAHGAQNQRSGAVHPELFHNARTVRFHRMQAQGQQGGDILVAVAFGQQLINLALALGQ